MLRSPVGLRFEAIRENDRRARLIGINVYLCRLSAFVMAGAVAGLSRPALFAFFGRYASASYMFYHVSGEATVWAIVAALARCSVRCSERRCSSCSGEVVSTVWENYLFAVGALTVLVCMFAPRGLGGLWSDLVTRLSPATAASASKPRPRQEAAP